MSRITRETRRASYKAVLPKVNRRCQQILNILGTRSMTASEIADRMVALGEIPRYNRNYVAPRLTDLKAMGILETCGRRRSSHSQTMEAVWRKKATLKPGDKVRMTARYEEGRENPDKVWTVRSEPWMVGGTLVVKLEGKAGGYAVDGLEIVEHNDGDLPKEG